MKKSFKNIFLLLLVAFAGHHVNGQSNTMYYQTEQPHANYLNPASQPYCSFFLNFPLTTFYVEGSNNSIGFTDFVYNDPNSDKVIHPLHSPEDLEKFIGKMAAASSLTGKLDITLLSFGFRADDMYFTYDASLRNRISLSYAADFIDFLARGNENEKLYNFSGIGVQFSSYIEHAFGISKNFNDQLWVGVRPKLLSGLAYISTDNSSLELYTSVEEWQVNAQLEAQLAFPGLVMPTDDEGNIDATGKTDYDSDGGASSILGNRGFGLDIGVHYKPIEKLTVSFSALDIGYIKWRNYNHTATFNSHFEFVGVEYTANSNPDSSQFFPSIQDTLKNNISSVGNSNPFKTTLGTKLFIGGTYALLPSVNAGALIRFDLPYMKEDFETSLMFHANWHPSSVLAFSANFQPIGKKGSTMGLGTFFRLGIFSFYTVIDYFPLEWNKYQFGGVPVPYPAQGIYKFNTRLGFTMVIGNNKNRKLRKDKPMYYSEDNQ